jgi:hypothetical protein
MIKWFCDLCKLEIVAPEHPTNVRTSRCGKNREDADVGWGNDDNIFSVFAHKACADVLEVELKAARRRAEEMVINNA